MQCHGRPGEGLGVKQRAVGAELTAAFHAAAWSERCALLQPQAFAAVAGLDGSP